ncbi:MAG: penicillin-binding protein [Ruminococcaceae bacterium]|nr:penicillin-binding protein [Oscillospiraceae bacterium]
MKRIMTRSILVFIVTLAFFAGICLLAFRLVTQNEAWVAQPYNGHVAQSNGLAQAGDIVDRNDTVLAYTNENEERIYHEDLSTRKALLHVVGDNSLNISTAVQSMYRGDLTGYSFILGLGLPKSLRTNNSVELTVSASACKAAYEAMGGKDGACVVYNYKTGEVLCDISTPTYDPQNPPEITDENEKEYDGVYLDNVMSSSYTPGSIFKIVTAAAAIDNVSDIYDQTFECSGAYDIEGRKITCENAHGVIDFNTAFAQSCNVAFAQIAVQVGEEKMTQTATDMGFNKTFEVSGVTLSKSVYSLENALGDNQLAWSGIGQFEDLANPMHMALMCGAIANGGTPVEPYLLSSDTPLFQKLGITSAKESDEMLSPDIAKKVQDLMRSTADYYYNVRGLTMGEIDFCAKTGTAEVGEDKEPTAWFIGFTEDEDHPYAFAAVVEEGGYGISAATPVAQAAITALVNEAQ